jgi:hypothetical protein
VTNHRNSENAPTVKAGALLCPVCCVEYIEAEVDFDVGGEILHNVKILRCPICQDEQFPPEQQDAFIKKEKK